MPFREITYDLDIWHTLAELPYTIFFDGNERFSYILINPKQIWHDWHEIKTPNPIERIPGLPPFQGGIAGFISYELAHKFNPVSKKPLFSPELVCGLYEQVFAFDNVQKKAWKIWQTEEPFVPKAKDIQPISFGSITTDFGESGFLEHVHDIKNLIANGQVYQVNISDLYTVDANYRANDLYMRLRSQSPAPLSVFANLKDFAILSSSPERFIKIQNDRITTAPIKGTSARSDNITQDIIAKNTLINSTKDRAENIMIVDLMRNDFSKICMPESVSVTELCGLYSFSNVHHLISTISGTLKPNETTFSAFKACIAAGSITGAPKVMAMDIIADIEQKPRGVYCGHMFWTDGHSNLDSNILIRTIKANPSQLEFRVGCGITYLSNPKAEYHELLAKASSLLKLCSH